MEKCPKKTLARTLTCGARCAKVVLAAALFAPAFFASVQISEKTRPVTASDVKGVEVLEKPRPKELVKIYSIVKSHRPDIADSEIWNVSEVILEESSKRTLDPLLVLALIRIESGFQYTPVSPSGARGIMQIMPETGKSLAKSLGREYGLRPIAFRPESLDDPLLNIQLGILLFTRSKEAVSRPKPDTERLQRRTGADSKSPRQQSRAGRRIRRTGAGCL
jgi:hypothetical protein